MPTKYHLHPVGPQQVQIVFALGDIHGLWNQLNAVINTNFRLRRMAESTKVEVVVLQCGDFGYCRRRGRPQTPYPTSRMLCRFSMTAM